MAVRSFLSGRSVRYRPRRAAGAGTPLPPAGQAGHLPEVLKAFTVDAGQDHGFRALLDHGQELVTVVCGRVGSVADNPCDMWKSILGR